MRNKKIGTWIARLLITMLTVLGLGQTMVHADANTTPGTTGHTTNVIITKLESDAQVRNLTPDEIKDGINFESEYKTIPNVSFNYYKIDLSDLDANGNLTGVLPESPTGTVTTGNLGTAELNLDEGVYWFEEVAKGTIASSSAVPFSLVLPYTNNNGDGYLEKVHVYPKNVLKGYDANITKAVDKVSVNVGDPNTWTVSLNIPDGIEDYAQFSFYDEIDSRLDFAGIENVIATSDDIDLVKGTDYKVTHVGAKLEVVFEESGRIKLKGADQVAITFKTKVNNTAEMGAEIPNTATLEFDNGLGTDGSMESNEVFVYTSGKVFVKKDEKTKVILNGAEFKIKNAAGKFVNIGENDGVITFVETGGTTFKADDGTFGVKGLENGTYTLVETKAPNGYALPTNREVGTFEVTQSSYNVESPQTITNRKLTIPQTGGMGTVLFTVVGAVMMLFSALFYKRTKEA